MLNLFGRFTYICHCACDLQHGAHSAHACEAVSLSVSFAPRESRPQGLFCAPPTMSPGVEFRNTQLIFSVPGKRSSPPLHHVSSPPLHHVSSLPLHHVSSSLIEDEIRFKRPAMRTPPTQGDAAE